MYVSIITSAASRAPRRYCLSCSLRFCSSTSPHTRRKAAHVLATTVVSLIASHSALNCFDNGELQSPYIVLATLSEKDKSPLTSVYLDIKASLEEEVVRKGTHRSTLGPKRIWSCNHSWSNMVPRWALRGNKNGSKVATTRVWKWILHVGVQKMESWNKT